MPFIPFVLYFGRLSMTKRDEGRENYYFFSSFFLLSPVRRSIFLAAGRSMGRCLFEALPTSSLVKCSLPTANKKPPQIPHLLQISTTTPIIFSQLHNAIILHASAPLHLCALWEKYTCLAVKQPFAHYTIIF